jgi:hypothetical protein
LPNNSYHLWLLTGFISSHIPGMQFCLGTRLTTLISAMNSRQLCRLPTGMNRQIHPHWISTRASLRSRRSRSFSWKVTRQYLNEEKVMDDEHQPVPSKPINRWWWWTAFRFDCN